MRAGGLNPPSHGPQSRSFDRPSSATGPVLHSAAFCAEGMEVGFD